MWELGAVGSLGLIMKQETVSNGIPISPVVEPEENAGCSVLIIVGQTGVLDLGQ